MIEFIEIATTILIEFIQWVIILEVFLSWIITDSDNYFMNLIHIITDPFIVPFKKLQDKFFPGFMIDISPLCAILLLWLIENIIKKILNIL